MFITTLIMKHYILIVFTIISFLACNNRNDNIYIPREKFIAILADIHLADAYYAIHYEERKTHGDSVNLYNSIFANYGYTRAQFDTTLKFYSINTEKFDQVYEEVITRLNKTEQDFYSNRMVDEQNSRNLWYGKDTWFLPEEGSRKKIPISLKLSGKGKYVIHFTYKVYSDDESKNPRLNLYFSDSAGVAKKDTLKTILYEKDARTSIVTVNKELKDSSVTHLKGFLLDHDEKSGRWKKHVVISGLKVFYTPISVE